MPCDVPKSWYLPTLNSGEERFQPAHETIDFTPYIVVGFVIRRRYGWASFFFYQTPGSLSLPQLGMSMSHISRGGWIRIGICGAWTCSGSSSISFPVWLSLLWRSVWLILVFRWHGCSEVFQAGHFPQCFAGMGVACANENYFLLLCLHPFNMRRINEFVCQVRHMVISSVKHKLQTGHSLPRLTKEWVPF